MPTAISMIRTRIYFYTYTYISNKWSELEVISQGAVKTWKSRGLAYQTVHPQRSKEGETSEHTVPELSPRVTADSATDGEGIGGTGLLRGACQLCVTFQNTVIGECEKGGLEQPGP